MRIFESSDARSEGTFSSLKMSDRVVDMITCQKVQMHSCQGNPENNTTEVDREAEGASLKALPI